MSDNVLQIFDWLLSNNIFSFS